MLISIKTQLKSASASPFRLHSTVTFPFLPTSGVAATQSDRTSSNSNSTFTIATRNILFSSAVGHPTNDCPIQFFQLRPSTMRISAGSTRRAIVDERSADFQDGHGSNPIESDLPWDIRVTLSARSSSVRYRDRDRRARLRLVLSLFHRLHRKHRSYDRPLSLSLSTCLCECLFKRTRFSMCIRVWLEIERMSGTNRNFADRSRNFSHNVESSVFVLSYRYHRRSSSRFVDSNHLCTTVRFFCIIYSWHLRVRLAFYY